MAVSTKAILKTAHPSLLFLPDDVWRLSVEQYHKMIDAEILDEDDPVELLEGILVTKMAKHPPHRIATQLTRGSLEALTVPGWYADAQEPITLTTSEPEPDVTVVRGRRRQYLDHHPGAEDIGLVVEVADSSLARDRGLKKRTYANAGIPVYWIINLAERKVEVYSEPAASDYQQRQDYDADAEVPVVLDGQEVGRLAVRDLLP